MPRFTPALVGSLVTLLLTASPALLAHPSLPSHSSDRWWSAQYRLGLPPYPWHPHRFDHWPSHGWMAPDYRHHYPHRPAFVHGRPLDRAREAPRPAVGQQLELLPPGYLTIDIGGDTYFEFEGSWYQWLPQQRQYQVINDPRNPASSARVPRQ